MKSKSKNIVTFATLGALIAVSMWLDRLLTIYLPVSAAFITLSVTFSFGLIKNRFVYAVAAGLIFGMSSWLLSVVMGTEAFINPLISVLPRFIVGFVLFGVYKLMQFILRKLDDKKRETVSVSVASGLSAATNTALVVTALALFGKTYYTGDALKLLLLVNALPELILSATIVPIIVLSVRKSLRISVTAQPKIKSVKSVEIVPAESELTENNEISENDSLTAGENK